MGFGDLGLQENRGGLNFLRCVFVDVIALFHYIEWPSVNSCHFTLASNDVLILAGCFAGGQPLKLDNVPNEGRIGTQHTNFPRPPASNNSPKYLFLAPGGESVTPHGIATWQVARTWKSNAIIHEGYSCPFPALSSERVKAWQESDC